MNGSRMRGIKQVLIAGFISSTVLFAPSAAAKDADPPALTVPLAGSQQAPPHYYINRDGQIIQSPTRTVDSTAPKGASAKCSDGTFSFSAHRQGTCSHHGGVAVWL